MSGNPDGCFLSHRHHNGASSNQGTTKPLRSLMVAFLCQGALCLGVKKFLFFFLFIILPYPGKLRTGGAVAGCCGTIPDKAFFVP
jgi:hypothetical protein